MVSMVDVLVPVQHAALFLSLSLRRGESFCVSGLSSGVCSSSVSVLAMLFGSGSFLSFSKYFMFRRASSGFHCSFLVFLGIFL